MKISDIKLRINPNVDSIILAYVSAVLDDIICVDNIRLCKRETGGYKIYMSDIKRNHKYYPIVKITDKQQFDLLLEAIVEQYEIQRRQWEA